MFERFSRDARTGVVLAQEVARSLGDTKIRVVHLLAGLTHNDAFADLGIDHRALLDWLAVHPGGGMDKSALSSLGIDLEAIRTSVESAFGEGALDADPEPRRRWPFGRRTPSRTGHIPFTGDAKKALELSLREALRLGLGSIGSDVMLLGILRGGDAQVRRFLAEAKLDTSAIRRTIEDRLRRAA